MSNNAPSVQQAGLVDERVGDAWQRWRSTDRPFVVAPGVYDGLTAKIAAHIGFDALYMTGGGTAASLGMPDVGLTTLSEMVANVARIVEVSGLPVIADADTGYGGALNVVRTVRAYERAGAAGLHIEDQVFPKKCGFFEGKEIVPVEEHVQKVKAACDARDDDGFVIIARTDALAVNGWDDVVERVLAYHQAGADLVFVDGIKTRADLDAYVEEVVRRDIPSLYNGALVSSREAEALGFRIQICADRQRCLLCGAHGAHGARAG
jgi:2,3-dimethylmalate lyase